MRFSCFGLSMILHSSYVDISSPYFGRFHARIRYFQDQKILNIMVSKANREEVEKRLQATRKLELAEEQKLENEMKQMRIKRHQMQLAERMKENEEIRVRLQNESLLFFIAKLFSSNGSFNILTW